jgi:hypothetical protein
MIQQGLESDPSHRGAVFRLWSATGPIATAFGVGPRLALTCHHCVATQIAADLTLRIGERVFSISEILEAPSPFSTDAAVLRLSDDLPAWLPANGIQPPRYGELVAYGYPGTSAQQPLVPIHLQLRSEQPSAYGLYSLAHALALAGDPATYGMSGGPLIDTAAGVAVGMIVGGPDYDNRALALPLWAFDSSDREWKPFAAAMAWNRLKTVQRGWALNYVTAQTICRQQVGDAIARLVNRKRYDRYRHVRREHLRHCQQIMFTSAVGPDSIAGWTTNRALPRSSRRFVA